MRRKMTILLGSPRRNGNSATLASSLAAGAAEAGYEVQSIWVNGLKITGCIDCRRCWTNGTHCFLNDDMKSVYSAIDLSSVIAFASPLYFYSWSAQIKPVWDRLLPYFSPNSKVDARGRRAVLISVAGDSSASCFDGLKKSFKLACDFAGWKIAGEILAYGLHAAGDASGRKEWLDKAFGLGKKL
ncbi:MAG: flavodoxin family protein [Synergistaceae bacterium]|nr:flavodoxin family protein [Synergistaceae bacterium]